MRTVELACTTKQREFMCAAESGRYDQIFFGGARGTAKTRTLAMLLVMRAIQYDHSYHLLMRRVRTAGEMTLGREVQRVLRRMGFSVRNSPGCVVFAKDTGRLTFPNGSVLQLGYCKAADDWQNYQGGEYATIAWDEVTQFNEEAYDRVNASNRPGRSDLQSLVLSAGNPGGPGHEFVRRRLIESATRDRRTYVVLSTLRENHAMIDLDPGYGLRVLRRLPPALRAQWERGDWSAVEGAFFLMPDGFWCEPEVPVWATLYAGVDAGYWPSAFACVWVAMWNEGRKRRIHILRDLKRYKLDAASQASEALIEEAQLPRPVSGRYADAQAWMRTERSNLEGAANTAMIWAANKWVVAAAPKSPRADGWMALRTLMAGGTLTADPRCKALRFELEGALHDIKTDDLAQGCDDHVLDALRYFINTMVVAHAPRQMADDGRLPDRHRKLAKKPTLIIPGVRGASYFSLRAG